MDDLEPQYANSAPFMFAYRQVIHADGTHETAHAAGVRAHEIAVWGADAKRDPKTGAFIQQGVGSRGARPGTI
jgi:hypothetical protein